METEKSLVNLQRKIYSYLSKISKKTEEFLLRIQDMNVLESICMKFNLPIKKQLSETNRMFFDFFALFKQDVENKMGIFESKLFDYLAFHRSETSNLAKFCSYKGAINSKLDKSEQHLRKKNDLTLEIKTDFQLLRTYLNTMTYYNFKQTFLLQSDNFKQDLRNKLVQQLDFHSTCFDQCKRLLEKEQEVGTSALPFEISMVPQEQDRSQKGRLLWKSIVNREEMESLDLKQLSGKTKEKKRDPALQEISEENADFSSLEN